MKLGIFSRTYEYSEPDKSFDAMVSHGIHRTQLNLSNGGMPALPERLDEEKLSKLEKALSERRIVCDALSGTFNMIDPDGEALRRGIRQFELQCEIAARLNIPIVSLCTGSRHEKSKWLWHEDNLKDSSWSELLRTTEKILRFAENSGVILGVEPEVHNIINSAQRARRYLDEFQSPRLKIIMDGANIFTAGNIGSMRGVLLEAMDALGRDIVLAHGKDVRIKAGEPEYVSPGCGLMDYGYYISQLKAAGYDGSFIMHGLREAEVPRSRAFLEGLI